MTYVFLFHMTSSSSSSSMYIVRSILVKIKQKGSLSEIQSLKSPAQQNQEVVSYRLALDGFVASIWSKNRWHIICNPRRFVPRWNMNTMFDVIGLYSFHYNFKYRIYATIMQLVLGEKKSKCLTNNWWYRIFYCTYCLIIIYLLLMRRHFFSFIS